MKPLKKLSVFAVVISALLCAGCGQSTEQQVAMLKEFRAACDGTLSTTVTIGSVNTIAVTCHEPKQQ